MDTIAAHLSSLDLLSLAYGVDVSGRLPHVSRCPACARAIREIGDEVGTFRSGYLARTDDERAHLRAFVTGLGVVTLLAGLALAVP